MNVKIINTKQYAIISNKHQFSQISETKEIDTNKMLHLKCSEPRIPRIQETPRIT